MLRRLFLLLLIATPVWGQEAFTPAQLEMHRLASEHRARNGLAPQRLDVGLCRQAQRLAEAQSSANAMFHSGFPFAENVAYGASPTATIGMWIRSSAHNRNLLSSHSHCGFGYSGVYAASLHGAAYAGPDLQVNAANVSAARRIWRPRFRATWR